MEANLGEEGSGGGGGGRKGRGLSFSAKLKQRIKNFSPPKKKSTPTKVVGGEAGNTASPTSSKPPGWPPTGVFPTREVDVSSCANVSEAIVQHIHLDVDVCFERREVTGDVFLDVLHRRGCRTLRLDSHESLKVSSVRWMDVDFDPSNGTVIPGEEHAVLEFEEKPFADFGTALHITLPVPDQATKKAETVPLQLCISYQCGAGPGLCWLDPAQTCGKKLPYMFTQGQAVLNRSFFPCQDTPSVRVTFSAAVRAPEGLTVVMSAEHLSPAGGERRKDGVVEFRFNMPQSIPAYLVAMAVGDLAKAPIGPRSDVWTEPAMLDASVREFQGVTEQYLVAGERLFGPYRWDRYDLLVMPPCFPWGGMENPRLTFVTPCLLCDGTQALTDTIAHEIAHSWFGNLVTNASWSDFFLNEGFTTYAQRRITDEVHGRAFTALEAKTGWALLEKEIAESGSDSPATQLRVPLEGGVDPEDTYNDCPYEKGFAFVSYLASLVGDQPIMDAWLRDYVSNFAFQCIMAEDMLEHFLASFPKLRAEGVAMRAGFEFIDTWLYAPGLPPFTPDFSASDGAMSEADALFGFWAVQGQAGPPPFGPDQVVSWPLFQQLYFLDRCLGVESGGDFATVVCALDELYGFADSKNAEIQLRWCQLACQHGADQFLDGVKRFLRLQGKQKYTLPVYRALLRGSAEAKACALDIFSETSSSLHVQVRNYVAKLFANENVSTTSSVEKDSGYELVFGGDSALGFTLNECENVGKGGKFRGGLVSEVFVGSAAERKGVAVNDVLVQVNGQTGTYDDIVDAVTQSRSEKRPMTLTFQRGATSDLLKREKASAMPRSRSFCTLPSADDKLVSRPIGEFGRLHTYVLIGTALVAIGAVVWAVRRRK